MPSISVSEFKATCLAVLDRVRRTGETVLITKHGEPLAEVVPPRPVATPGRRNIFGSMAGTITVPDDIMDPVIDGDEVERAIVESWDEANRSKP
jgi:prevent-host-death family protein